MANGTKLRSVLDSAHSGLVLYSAGNPGWLRNPGLLAEAPLGRNLVPFGPVAESTRRSHDPDFSPGPATSEPPLRVAIRFRRRDFP